VVSPLPPQAAVCGGKQLVYKVAYCFCVRKRID